jgi:hypothetical protein
MIAQSNILELCSVVTPYFFHPVEGVDGNQDRITGGNAENRRSSQYAVYN